ncbi:uncharacterized protein MONOS_12333 [Monocercomonoides exilis]|uniref:uncharacterized protein n=1 Tax=Monocercomonoides exilis TaxID=2049356 RepID=UPI0035599A10|nr:hypothetical protein MONOS_12333 [Monocercomonoides exilis]|eukprot:MONOS_12333.1-p1 / transcript=MONOS_12333.1 / gene=MONOS_12333 / organism=Monocercomonoides_exilis_PA203 / gene_product=unspecified product / transcript_product=unspecified product / location=Mono_scaffold00677:18697-19727(+) / protein_length=325 / sequence_SO=supercontig / SO=protein_coding / is_pseudo=false
MIFEEEKREEKNERLLVDLCECYLLLGNQFNSELIPICMSCLFKVALNKQEDEETQKEVEMALLALRRIYTFQKMEKELYFNEINEIIQHHQEHHNLTQLAYQSAWGFLIYRLRADNSLEEVIVNELHFGREAARELEELSNCVDWKRKEEVNGRIEVMIIRRWLNEVYDFFDSSILWNEEFAGLIGSIVQVFRASRDNHKGIRYGCLYSLEYAAEKRNMEIDAFVKEGAVDLFLEEMKQSTLKDNIIRYFLNILLNFSRQMKAKKNNEMEEAKRKELKRKLFEMNEEEGYEDTITCFHGIFSFLFKNGCNVLSLDVSDYLVNV